MKIVSTSSDLFMKRIEYEYYPSPAELFYYYSGTHTGWNRENIFVPRAGATATKVTYVKQEAHD